MKTFELKAQVREDLGKKGSKKLREQEIIPAVIYSEGFNKAIQVSTESVRKLIYTPYIYIINMDIDGETRKCILKDIQFHPVTDRVLHIDFLQVSEDKPIVIDVPVKLTGHAEGVRAGGKLSLDMRKIRVKGLYENIPAHLDVDVSNLGLGKTLQIGELEFENLELMNAKNNVVAAVKLTRAARGAAASAAASSKPAAEK